MALFRTENNESLVVAFDSTASALGFASVAQQTQLPGRLIPVPRSLSTGCGIAWRDLPENQAEVEHLIEQECIHDARCVIMRLP